MGDDGAGGLPGFYPSVHLGEPSGLLLDQTPPGELGAGTLEIASAPQVLRRLDPWGCVIGYGTVKTS